MFQDWFVMPYRSITHFKNDQLRKTLNEKKFFEDLYDKKASALIVVGNFSLMRRLFTDLNKVTRIFKAGLRVKEGSETFENRVR